MTRVFSGTRFPREIAELQGVHVDLSGQWSKKVRWSGVGRWVNSYSIRLNICRVALGFWGLFGLTGCDPFQFITPPSTDEILGKCLGEFQIRGLRAQNIDVITDGPEVDRIRAVANRLFAETSSFENFELRVHLVLTDTVNAFTTGGGYLFVNAGLVEQLKTEAELAGVLAHEITHMTERHVIENLQRTPFGGLILTNPNGLCQLLDAIPMPIPGSSLQLTSEDAAFSQNLEFEADAGGAELAVQTGYDAYGLASFLENLVDGYNAMLSFAANSGCPIDEGILSHPNPSVRIERLQEQFEGRPDLGVQSPFVVFNEDLFQSWIDSVTALPIVTPTASRDICGNPLEKSSIQKNQKSPSPGWEEWPVPLPPVIP